MTEPDLTAAQQEAVRRLLADARADEPMPADVAARLDEVVAGLSAARSGGGDVVAFDAGRRAAEPAGSPEASSPSVGEPGSVDDSSRSVERRRDPRRRWPAYLLSAAAVVAIGFGVTQMIPSDDDTSSDAGSATVDAEDQDAGVPENNEALPSDSPSEPPSTAANAAPPLPDVPGLEATDRGKDAQSLARQEYAVRLAERCGPGELPAGTALRSASYQGKEALVVYLPPTPTGRQVDIYACTVDPDQPARTVTLPAGE